MTDNSNGKVLKAITSNPVIGKTVVGSAGSILIAMVWNVLQEQADIQSKLDTQGNILRNNVVEMDVRLNTFSSVYNERMLEMNASIQRVINGTELLRRDFADVTRRVNRVEEAIFRDMGDKNGLR